MIIIGAELPKLSQIKLGIPFFGPPCILFVDLIRNRLSCLDSAVQWSGNSTCRSAKTDLI